MNRMSKSVGLSLIFFVSSHIVAQVPTTSGSLEVSGRVKIDGKQQKLTRKRFYLLRGGLAENKSLLDRIRNTEIISRDCYYSRAQASSQFICWLQTEDCESPYCRKVETPDIERVPEFKAAFQKGLTLFGQKRDIAQIWLTTNLAPALTGGFYREQQSLLKKILGGINPVQSSMTDSATAKSLFVDISTNAVGENKGETFTVSNILPIELNGKSYVWSCQVEIAPEETALVRLQVPENNNPVKNCEVVIKELVVCKSGGCSQK